MFITERDRDHRANRGGSGWEAAVPQGTAMGQVFPPCSLFGLVPASNAAMHLEEAHSLSPRSFAFQAQLALSTSVFTQHVKGSKRNTHPDLLPRQGQQARNFNLFTQSVGGD